MSIKPPFTELEIEKAPSGFYEGYSLPIALLSKIVTTQHVFDIFSSFLLTDGLTSESIGE